jgi:hypothetical protein
MTERDGDDGPGVEQAGQEDRKASGSVWEEAVQEEQPGPARTSRRPGETPGPGRGASRHAGDRRPARPRQPGPGADVLSDFQRWLLRSSAKSMGREISGQVRKSLGGGRQDRSDVWDTATTEIPPEVGESPECQWCPICRAARRMRDSSPGLGDQLSAAGDVVATAVHEAMRAFDSVVPRPTGSPAPRAGHGEHAAGWSATADGHDSTSADLGDWVAARDAWAAAHGAQMVDGSPSGATPAGDQQDELTSEPDGPDEPDDRG